MKKIVCVLFVLCVLLCSCNKNDFSSESTKDYYSSTYTTKKESETDKPKNSENYATSSNRTTTSKETTSTKSTTDSKSTTSKTEPTINDPIIDPDEDETSKIKVLSLTETIGINENASITIKGRPNTLYKIKVMYSTTASKAAGLEDKMSDESGNVTWTWKVGAKVKTYNSYKITITSVNDGTESITRHFYVIP